MQCFLCQADEHADPLCASCMPLFKPVASGSSLPWTIGKTVTKIQQQTYGVVVELTDDVLVFAISEFQLCCESFDFELHESNLLPGDLLLSVTVEPTVQKEEHHRPHARGLGRRPRLRGLVRSQRLLLARVHGLLQAAPGARRLP